MSTPVKRKNENPPFQQEKKTKINDGRLVRPDPLSNELNLSDVFDYDVKTSSTMNIMMIGDSRAGKTTFLKYFADLNHCVSSEIYRGTLAPESKVMTLSFQGKIVTLNFIDTPGINELAKDGNRGNDAIFDLISGFVRRDITKIHMVMITMNISSGFTSHNLATIMSIVSELGKDFTKNICLLVSNYEDYGESDEQSLRDSICNDSALSVLNMACKAGVLFTGGMTQETYDDVSLRDKFMVRQKKRICEFIDVLMRMIPTDMRTERVTEINSRMKSVESIMKDYSSAIRMGPKVRKMVQEIQSSRQELGEKLSACVNAELKVEVENVIKRASKVGDPNEYKTDICDDAVNKLKSHFSEALQTSERVEKLRISKSDLENLQNEIIQVRFELMLS